MTDLNHHIRTYENFVSPEFCDSLIAKYEHVWATEQDKISSLNICPGWCVQCKCNRLDIMQHSIFNEDVQYLARRFVQHVPIYANDTRSTNLLPEQYELETLKMKRFLPDSNHAIKEHVDVIDKDSARRYVAMMVYLNDNFDGGETEFTLSQLKIKPKQGMLIMFPPVWTLPHKANPVLGKNAKYWVGSYLCYMGYKEYSSGR